MQKVILSGLFLFLIIFPSYAFADGPYLNIPPTNAFDKIHSDNGTVTAANFSMPLNIKGGSNCSVLSSNGTHTVTISCTASGTGSKGTYNQTLANNSVVNSGGQGLNFINGTNSTISLVNDPTRNQINITISSTGGSGSSGVSSLNALTGALTIACVAGNTTCTTSGGNTITINTAYNIATLNLNEIFSGITTMNNLKLGGIMDINNQQMESYGHKYNWPNNTGTICLTNQTGSCGPGSSATYDTMQNVGTGEGSIYKGNSTNTNFQFKTLKQGSHISITNNTNDVTIGTTGLLSSALLSLNGDTTAAQVVASGNTNHITVTNAGANHSIDTAFKINNNTGTTGKAVTSFDNVTGNMVNSYFVNSVQNIGHGGKGLLSGVSNNILQGKNITSANSGITVSSNNTDVLLTSNALTSAITSLNGQSGPSVNIVRQPGYTVVTNSTNQVKVGIDATGVMELNGTQTATGSKTLNALILGGDANVGSNALTNSGHKSTLPLTTGILCQTNQTTTCGTNSGVTSITGTAHNVTASASTGAVTLNTGDNVVVTGLSAQTVTKPIKLNQLNASSSMVDDNDNTKKVTWLLSGMTTGKVLTIRSNQTTTQGINIPNLSATDTFATLGLSQTYSGTPTYSNGILISTTKKVSLNTGATTYITETSSGVLDIYAASGWLERLTASTALVDFPGSGDGQGIRLTAGAGGTEIGHIERHTNDMELSANTNIRIISPINMTGKITTYDNVLTKGIGVIPAYNATLQKSETATADANILTYTPPASTGMYRINYQADVSSATSGVISFTVSYKDSNGNTITNNALPLFQQGTAAPNTTFTTSAASRYSGNYLIDVDNTQTKIIVKWVGGGTTAAKVSVVLEQLQ